jgi:hypothetical protein
VKPVPATALALPLLLGAAAAFAGDLPSSTGAHRVRFEADSAQFNEYTRVIDLSGEVRLEEVNASDRVVKVIKARSLSVDMDSSTVVSPSEFVVDDDTGTIYGKSGRLNYATDHGVINGARFAYGNFVFRGRQVAVGPDGYVYKKASVTSCDEEPPHYTLRASRIYLAPGRYFLAYNTALFLGRVPVFYFPVLYRPDGGGTPFVSSFFPGYDQRSGLYLKSNYAYKVNPETRVRVYLDFFDKRGLGTGGEVDFRRSEKNISNLSAYRIREYGSRGDRWGVNGGFWHSFNRFNESDPAQYYAQSSFRLISDPAFNNDFFRSNPFAVSPDKQAGAALTRRSGASVLRLSAYGREERRTPTDDRFRKAYESSPRLDYSVLPFAIKGLPVLHSFAGHLESAKEVDAPYYQRKGRGAWTVSKTVPLLRNLTLSPAAFYDQSVAFSTHSAGHTSWVGRYGASANLRYDRVWGSMDLRYAHQRRLREGTFVVDRSSADHGQEADTLFADLFVMPRLNAYFRARTSYDLRYYYTAPVSRRLSPLIAEVYYAPRPSLDIYVENSYSFAEGNRSFVTQLNFGGGEKYFGAGVANYSTDPGAWIVSNTMGFKVWRAPAWRAEAVLRYRAVPESGPGFRSFRFFEKAVSLYRDFHDFRTRWDFRVRSGGVKEFFFFVNLKMNDPAKHDDLEEKSRAFWRPWRQPGAARD